MKKVLLLLLICINFNTYGQVIRVSNKTELYEWVNEKWKVYETNYDTNIEIKFDGNYISIDALVPSLLKLTSSHKINGDGWSGYSYESYNIPENDKLTVQLISFTETRLNILTIINHSESIMFRYYIK